MECVASSRSSVVNYFWCVIHTICVNDVEIFFFFCTVNNTENFLMLVFIICVFNLFSGVQKIAK